jgi:CRP-like cAMP-binding protein
MPPRSKRNSTTGNRFLDAMPHDIRERVRKSLRAVALDASQTIHEPGRAIEHVYFPTSGFISMLAKDGPTAIAIEIGMIGKEGMFSASAMLGDGRPSYGAMVQLAGRALRMKADTLRREAQANAALRAMLLRYGQVHLITVAQNSACNRLHLLEQRFARWLLSAHDRAEGDSFAMTHELLAMMLGVRRPGVTLAAQTLQADGLISYTHGAISVVDRKGLEARSCYCYAFVQSEFARLMGPRH